MLVLKLGDPMPIRDDFTHHMLRCNRRVGDRPYMSRGLEAAASRGAARGQEPADRSRTDWSFPSGGRLRREPQEQHDTSGHHGEHLRAAADCYMMIVI